jgi:diacylglycerol kinase
VVIQIDAMNLLGIVNRGSPKLALNTLAREHLWFCLSHTIVLLVEWVATEINAFVDEISKW